MFSVIFLLNMNSERIQCVFNHYSNDFPAFCPFRFSAIQLLSGALRFPLALLLLMLGVFADNHDVTLALDDLALLAHGLDRRSDFHIV